MPRAILFLALAILASSVRADDVSEAALAGRWKVVGTAPTAKNRDGLAELEKHGCYLYFEFAASGRAAIGIGSDSKAKLNALEKANPGVELEWSAKYEVVNGRVEISGFPARLREPGGWLGDSATAIFRVRLDGDTLELTGPGGFVAFQKVKKTFAATGGATGTKTNPKTEADSITGRWRFVQMLNSTFDPNKLYTTKGFHTYLEFGPNGEVIAGVDATDKQFITTYVQGIGGGKSKTTAKYKLGPGGALEISDLDPVVRARYGLVAGTFTYKINGDELTVSDGGTRPMKLVRATFVSGSLVGTWRLVKSTRFTADQARVLEETGTKILCVFDKDGGVRMEARLAGGPPAPAPPGQDFAWKYRFVSSTELEFFDVPQHLRTPTGPAGNSDKAKLRFELTGDTLELTETHGKHTLTYAREKM
jgi:hypothetical protein